MTAWTDTSRDRIKREQERFAAEVEAERKRADLYGRKRWEPRPVGGIPPIGPEHSDDLARLYGTPSLKGTTP